MAKFFDHVNSELKAFISQQHIFHVATATETSSINLSPKGMDSLRVIDDQTIVWLNLTGSGNETSGHLQENSRMTIMWCSFDEKPLILRAYGQAKAYHEGDEEYGQYIGEFDSSPGARQIIVLCVERMQTSCGFAVPRMDFVGERTVLRDWGEAKGREGIKAYWRQKNLKSIDGKDIQMPNV